MPALYFMFLKAFYSDFRYAEMIAKVISENSIPGDTVHVKDSDGNIVGKLKVVKKATGRSLKLYKKLYVFS